ncbi:ATP-binding protein [Paenibacillus sp. FJAT-26967]|uniref:hybrid sensor histidine kinase/response regulator n=1 Tax=Paenibacillus sp. FJAT-26967 TaxID=1729690 RepID=UPI000838C31C|nr:ATP-binding protein [Paenibacillus sp. FJAT-26967]
MGKSRLLMITSLILFILLPVYWFITTVESDRNRPVSREGFLDLSSWDFKDKGVVKLSGEWEFYRDRLLTPEDFRSGQGGEPPEPTAVVEVPGRWNDYISASGEYKATGYGTYRLRIRVSHQEQAVYGIRTTNIRTANRVFINGQDVGTGGTPGTSAGAAVPENVPYTGYASVSGDTVELIVQVSNFSYSSGGMIYTVMFGDQQSIIHDREFALLGDLVILAAYLIPALYFFVLFNLRKKERSLLYLGLFCLSAFIYVLTQGEKLMAAALPGMSYELFLKIQLLSSSFIYFFLLRYVAVSLPGVVHRAVLRISEASTVIQVLISLLLPPLIFSRLEVPVLLYGFISVCYVLYALLKSTFRRDSDSFLMWMSIQSILVIIVINLLNLIGWMQGRAVIHYEMLLFVSAQVLLLAKRFATTFHEVEQLSDKLLTLDGMKDEFMASTSHELRTPLNGIVNLAEAMIAGSSGELSEPQKRNLAMVVSTGKRLSSLVNDILDFSKLRKGDIKLQRKAVDLRSAAQSVMEVIGYTAGKKDIRLVLDLPEGLPLLDTDEDRLRQILYNLLGNALKFTSQGEVRLSARTDRKQVVISVADTGIGIRRERFRHIFKSYDQSGSAVHRQYEGTGLGLSITKKLVELNGGTIWVESEPGTGSVFHFTLPTMEGTSWPETNAPEKPVVLFPDDFLGPAVHRAEEPEYTVLVVDDDRINLHVLINLLSLENYEVIAVDNGQEALEEVFRNPSIDLVISDWMMPGMSGLELSRKIRERYLPFELPILLITARSLTEDIQAGFQAGINDFLSKPVDAGELRARVRTLLELRKSIRTTIQTEMAFLQAQIKPHFLYNALNTIIAICPVDPMKGTDLLIELSQYLRSSFDFQNRDRLTSVARELDLVKSYLAIEKARFDERLQVVIDADGSGHAQIPPLSIQPIVENAVRHGIMQKASGGTITLHISETRESVQVVVEDDGVGIKPERMKEILSDASLPGRGVGLRNIHKRLLTLYGNGLNIESKGSGGTKVSFEVPKKIP